MAHHFKAENRFVSPNKCLNRNISSSFFVNFELQNIHKKPIAFQENGKLLEGYHLDDRSNLSKF